MAKKRSIKHDSEDENESSNESPQKRPRNDDNEENNEHNENDENENAENSTRGGNGTTPIRSINKAGKPAEAGIIHKVYVENFMCHRKLTISLCRNVNFIHGQNGSGKSAILAAIQICLGAGAKRTHRARNLKDLVRKEGSASNSKVRVTLLNKGPDAYKPETYGETITIERSISLSGGYNGYKLLNHLGVAQSKSKKDLDNLLDQLNIQVENPVAVLDQEEAKKFLCGKPEDKYAFFSKATELERLDRQYASIYDKIEEICESRAKVEKTLLPKKEIVETLKKEWEQFEILERMEDKVGTFRVKFGWSLYWQVKGTEDEAHNTMAKIEEKLAQRREELAKEESRDTSDSNEEVELNQKLEEYTAEAEEASQMLNTQETKLKVAKQPLKQHERTLHSIGKEKNIAKRRHRDAVNELKNIRDEVMRRAGSAESEEAKRTAKRIEAENRINEIKEGMKEGQNAIHDALQKYQEKENPEETLNDNLNSAQRQLYAVKSKLQGLKSSEGNSMAMFGNKCVSMYERVEQAKRQRKFQGPVVGPIGHYLKVVHGKEHLAALATSAVKIGFDRFIVTNDHDRSYFMKLRNEIRCNSHECLIIQTNESPRYNVRQPPEGVETAATVITVSNDLVFNCLVDNGKIDQLALMENKAESEQKLLVQENGRSSIRGGNIREVHILPNGDFWQVYNHSVSMTSNRKRLRQLIGVDRTAAIRETENEIEQLSNEVNDLTAKAQSLKRERHQYKVRWNKLKKEDEKARFEMQRLEDSIETIREEAAAAENVTIDTREYEDDVKEAEKACEELKEKEEETRNAIEALKAPIREMEAKVEETKARSKKVSNDLNNASEKLKEYIRHVQQRDRVLDKKRDKVTKWEELRQTHLEIIASRTEKCAEGLQKAQMIQYQIKETQEKRHKNSSGEGSDEGTEHQNVKTQEEIDNEIRSIQPIQTNKEPNHWQQKIERAEKEIERERQRRRITEVDPEVALNKYQRARKDLENKIRQLQIIENNENNLVNDLRDRKMRWKDFQRHISGMSNDSFDEILNKKGSSGFIEFDHKSKQLNLVVQKDNRDENTQTNDVKALSGGERSFTTLSLLLALGESLETPFRVMDEFDVFLDPISRKIALETMIELAKELENRQFIFITPQDLSNIKTDPKLKIFHMKPPTRSALVGGASQQTLDFQASQ